MEKLEGEGIEFRLLQSDPSGRRITDALEELFSGDGTIYLVVGFFTYNGYRTIQASVREFLNRSESNSLRLVVGPSSDQFSPRIAEDLWKLDNGDQVEIYSYRRGLHAKLYLRDGPEPHVILGSANLTQVGFRYNVELGIEYLGTDRNHPRISPFIDWVHDLIGNAQPIKRRELFFPIQLWNSILNWTNKARLLPRRHVAKRVGPIIVIIIVVAAIVRVI